MKESRTLLVLQWMDENFCPPALQVSKCDAFWCVCMHRTLKYQHAELFLTPSIKSKCCLYSYKNKSYTSCLT